MNVLSAFADQGFLSVNFAGEYGGAGMTELEAMLLIEAAGRVAPDVGCLPIREMLAPRTVTLFSSETAKERYLPPVLDGEERLAVAAKCIRRGGSHCGRCRVRQRSLGVRLSHREEPGHPAPASGGVRACDGREAGRLRRYRADPRCRPVHGGCPSQHSEVPRRGVGVRGRQHCGLNLRRLRCGPGVRRGAIHARGPTDLAHPNHSGTDTQLSRHRGAGPPPVVLIQALSAGRGHPLAKADPRLNWSRGVFAHLRFGVGE